MVRRCCFLLWLPTIYAGDVEWSNGGKTKAKPSTAEFSTIDAKELKPIFEDGSVLFQSHNTLANGVNIPKQLGTLFRQFERTRNELGRYASVGMDALTSPTMVPGQQGRLPRLRGELLCNPELMDCASAGDLGAAIGEPILEVLHKSNLFRLGDQLFKQLQQVYEHATMGITDPLMDTLELEPLVQTLEHVYKTIGSNNIGFLKPKGQNPYTDTYRNAVDQVLFNSAERLGYTNLKGQQLLDTLEDYITCGAWRDCDGGKVTGNAKLRNPKPSSLIGQNADTVRVLQRTRELPLTEYLIHMFKKQNDPTSPVNSLAVDTSMQTADDTFPPSSNATDDIIKSQDQSQDQAQDQSQDQAQDQSQDQAQDQSQDQAPKDETGLPRLETGPRVYHTLYVHGFVDSCVRQKNCVANHKSMIPELFDGLYEMYSITGMDSLQSLDEVTSFNTFPSFNLVYKRLSLDKADLEAEQKWSRLYKDTLPELYLTLEHRRGSPGLDLKITAETPLSTTKHLSAASHPPFATLSDTCDNNDVAQCHNSHWLLQSAATYGCTSGVRFEGSCYYPAKISVLPASVEIETTS